jgi:hypothetical protein
MKTDVASCLEALTVRACAEMMRDNGVGFVPDRGRGEAGRTASSPTAISPCASLANDLPAETPVGHVMTRDVRICHPDDDLREAAWKMSSARKSGSSWPMSKAIASASISLSDARPRRRPAADRRRPSCRDRPRGAGPGRRLVIAAAAEPRSHH